MKRAGDRVGDRYEILGVIAEGGMGVVYRARDLKLLREVALKGLHGYTVADEEHRARIATEANAQAALSHPNIVTVFDVRDDEPDGNIWIAMELVEGPSLRRRLGEAGALPVREAVAIVRQIAAALVHAHSRGVIHRDVKPENVLLGPNRLAKLCDFGIVKSSVAGATGTWKTEASAPPGTAPYMAPERVRGGATSERADQFSLGVLAYEVLTGELPWDPGAVAAPSVFAAILVDPIRSAHARRPELPAAVDAVLARATAKAPEERFEDELAFAEALATALEVVPTDPRAVPDPWNTPRSSEANATPSSTQAPPAAVPWRLRTAAVVAGVAALGALALVAPRVEELTAGALEPAGGGVACPALEARVDGAPAVWLGAAAADEACRRLTWLFSGLPSRTRLPAELLDLRPRPGGAASDPWEDPAQRDRSLAAARAYPYVLDGEVTHASHGPFRVHLTLEETAHGRVLGRADGAAIVLHAAVGAALTRLVDAGALRPSPSLERVAAAFAGVRDADDALFARDLQRAITSGVDAPDRCVSAVARGALPLVASFAPVCTGWIERAGKAAVQWPEPVLPEHEGARLVWSARLRVPPCSQDPAHCLERLRALRAATAPGEARAQLALAEAELVAEDDAVLALSLQALARADAPRLADDYGDYPVMTAGQPQREADWLDAAWAPSAPDAWAKLSPLWAKRRAYVLGPLNGYHGLELAEAYAREGPSHRREARAVGERYAASGRPWLTLAGRYLLARDALLDGELRRARDGLDAQLRAVERFGHFAFGDVEALRLFRRLTMEVLEEDPETALVPLLERYLLGDAPRLHARRPYGAMPLLSACLHAGRAVVRRCVDALDRWFEANAAPPYPAWADCLEGARAWADDGDLTRAAALWRSAARAPAPATHAACEVPPALLEAGGAADLAAALDEAQAHGTEFAGADPARVRLAERAFARGRCAEAHAAARAVLERWTPTTLDTQVPAVERLERIVARCAAPTP